MDITQHYKPNRESLLSISSGILFVYVAIFVISHGAAVAVPESMLLPMAELSPAFAFASVDLVTVGIPVAVSFVMFAWLLKRLIKNVNYYLLAAPFVMLMLYGLIQVSVNSDYFFYDASKLMMKTLPLLGCVKFLANKA
ncbi:hypothetical protein [Alteromonas halophila]|uniref:Uncharacterized protein n=1 Tax=Alteromonas halophila TaxID=516698 RepID=A0A918JGH2_9ALTE|nr:hypothetical protein [Alteromonas halophila]GGW79653.1 hypothetical protein GCM10007391_10560 [Alteromonas halophila]